MIGEDNYTLLLTKLRDFKRKYYRNLILKGGIYFVAVFLVSYLLVTALEFFGRFDSVVRTVMFYSFIAANAFILGRFIVMPLLSLFGLRKSLSYPRAAEIIGRHFSEVKDKLLNTLQLKEQAGFASLDPFKRQLIEASVNQKITELHPVPFVSAVDYRRNRKYLKYALIPLLVIMVILWRWPMMLVQGTQRVVEYNKYFAVEAPFTFQIKTDSLTAVKSQDFPVDVQIKGTELPAEVYLLVDGNPYKMNSKSKTEFGYLLRNLQKDLSFQFSANGYVSQPYNLRVLPRPALQKFEVSLQYPAYINKKNDVLLNTGDITIPAGTTVNWKFHTENTDKVSFAFNGSSGDAKRIGDNEFAFGNRFLHDDSYILKTANQYLHNTDSIHYQINVVPDAYPEIKVEQQQDTLSLKNMYFSGEVSDDYGLTKLEFHYRFAKGGDSSRAGQAEKTIIVPISQGKLLQPFFYQWDMSSLNIKPGEGLEYYFKVWDNDGVNGSKATESQKNFFNAPTEKELEQNAEAENKDMENRMDYAIDQAKELQKQMSDMKMKLIDQKNLDWQDKKALQDMLKKQQDLKNTVEDLQKQYEKNLQKQNEFTKMDEKILQKHEELKKMFDQIMDDKTKKMFDELQKLLEQNNKDQVENQLDKMNFDDKEVQKELDRMEQLYKKLEFEQKVQQTADKLDTLSKKQDKLAEETAKNDKKADSKPSDQKQGDPQKGDQQKGDQQKADSKSQKDAKQQELEKQQEQLNKDFEDVKKDLGDLEKKNDNLERKEDMPDNKEQQQDISQEQQQSQQDMQKGQDKKASQSQKSAANKMQKMSKAMKDAMEGDQAKEHEEDYQALRQLLSNLLYVSFQEEDVMNEFKKTPQYNPHYVELGEKQRQLKDDSKLIEDSLNALSKRETQIKSYVNKEMGLVNFNMDQSIADLGLRNTGQAISHQQYAMTSLNNLALMLDESMKNMQAQMQQDQQQMQGTANKSCKKPGEKTGPSIKTMEELQKELGDEIAKLKEKQGKPGENGEQMSQELAENAARQEAIRRQLQQMKEELEKNGNKAGDLGELQKEMDQNEKDLVNRNITDETIMRQHDIMTRMLQSEKADRTQETDPQRESHTANDIKNPNPPELQKYLMLKQKETELLQTVPPGLSPYYRDKVKTYFEELDK